jgi:hypothetical protein
MVMNKTTERILSLYNGILTSSEIACIVGKTPRYVRKVAQKFDLPRLWCGAQNGKNNHRFVSGRRIDLDGYVLVTAPHNHPYARKRPGRRGLIIFEHRLVMEEKLGRHLLPTEVVDHIDGLTLHNCPSNLRLFPKNGEHLRVTLKALPKQISLSGLQNIKRRLAPPEDFQRIDTYSLRRERGDVRLRQILLAMLSLGTDNPYLLGTSHHLKKAHIDTSSRSTIEHALVELYQRWEEDLSR